MVFLYSHSFYITNDKVSPIAGVSSTQDHVIILRIDCINFFCIKVWLVDTILAFFLTVMIYLSHQWVFFLVFLVCLAMILKLSRHFACYLELCRNLEIMLKICLPLTTMTKSRWKVGEKQLFLDTKHKSRRMIDTLPPPSHPVSKIMTCNKTRENYVRIRGWWWIALVSSILTI